MATLRLQREAASGVVRPIPSHLRDAEEVDVTDISGDENTIVSRVSEAACIAHNDCPTVASGSFKEGVRTYYSQPEVYHQRWKANFFARNPAFKQRLLGQHS